MFGISINKKSKIIRLGVSFILLAGLIGGGYYYWWMGTPQYSLAQIKKAVATHNPELGLKYIDTDAIFDNLWVDVSGKLASETSDAGGFEGLAMMFGAQFFESMKPALKAQTKEGMRSLFLTPAEKDKEATSTKTALDLVSIWQKNLKIKTQGNLAYVELPNNAKVIFTKKSGARYWVISKLEGIMDNLPTALGAKQATEKTSEAATDKLKEKVDAELLSKDFLPASWERGTYQDYITMKLKFVNKTDKDIKGVHGTIAFYDIFDAEIYRTEVSYDEGIPKNDSKVWDGEIEYNEFKSDHKKLKATEFENLKFKWLPDKIVYQDGSVES